MNSPNPSLQLPRLAIVMGDPAGIGPEIVFKALESPQVHAHCVPVVVGDARILAQAPGFDARTTEIQAIEDVSQARPNANVLAVIDMANVPASARMSEPSVVGGKATLEFLAKAVDLALANHVQGVVFAPLNKEAMRLAGIKHPDEYGYFCELCGMKECSVIMVGPHFWLASVTLHVPIKEVAALITKERVLKTIRSSHCAASRTGLDHPRIAVSALNPHAGEHGLMGTEDEEEIRPAVVAARAEGIDASGPFPPDTLFRTAIDSPYDIYVGMYHDQGRIALKLIDFGHAITITEGLPFFACTVGHGTAYDIVGKGIANCENMREAILFAAQRLSDIRN